MATIRTCTALRACCPVNQFPFAPPYARLPFLHNEPPFFTYLEVPFLAIVVRMSIHTRPWLEIDWPTPCSLPSHPLSMAPTVHVTCFQRRHHKISYIAWYNNNSRYGSCKKFKQINNVRPQFLLNITKYNPFKRNILYGLCLELSWAYLINHYRNVECRK